MTKADRVHSTPPTNTPVAHTRRGFLGRAMTALAAGGAATTAIIVAAKPAPVAMIDEDPAIIALGDRIGPLLDTYRKALARHREARAVAEASCPVVPENIVCKGPLFAGCTERERDVEDKDVWPAEFIRPDGKTGVLPPRQIFNSKRAKAAIEQGNLHCDRRPSFGKRIVKMIETAEQYETGREAAIEHAGLSTAKTKLYWAAREIERLAYEAAEIKPRTMAGILVQARALTGYAEAEAEIELDHYCGRAGQVVGDTLAQSVLRIAAPRSRTGCSRLRK
jgi:hypothetical protein